MQIKLRYVFFLKDKLSIEFDVRNSDVPISNIDPS